MHDVTKQRELEEQLRHDALHDPLTGLWNRPAFAQYAEKACARAARDGSTLALLFVDLDGFKQVNDTLGHGLGDEVLVEVGEAAARLPPRQRGARPPRRRRVHRADRAGLRLAGRDRDRGPHPRDAHPSRSRVPRARCASARASASRSSEQGRLTVGRAAARRRPRDVLGEALGPVRLEARRPGRRREPGRRPLAASADRVTPASVRARGRPRDLPGAPARGCRPRVARPTAILDDLAARQSREPDVHGARLFGLVYPTGRDDLETLLEEVNRRYLFGNALNPFKFKELAALQDDVVSITSGLAPPAPRAAAAR